MPRHGKRKNRSRRRRSRRLDEEKATFWQLQIENAKSAKSDFTAMGQEVDSYFKSRHSKLFDSDSVQNHGWQFEGATAVSVPKSAQVRNNLGPHLYPANPKRNVNPKGQDSVLLGLARVLGVYINKTPKEGKIAREARKAIDDSLLRGRGFLRTGYDDRHQIVTSWYVSSRDVLIDPDVNTWLDAEWIAIRSLKPLFRVKREVTEGWRKKDLRANYGAIYGAGTTSDDDEKKSATAAHTNELVECWEVYSRMGDGRQGSEFAGEFTSGAEDDFVKLVIATNHRVPLFEGPWESPLYLDNEWPVEPIDFIETLDELWPESVMGQVMPLQKGMDLLTSLELSSCKQRGRFIMFGDMDLSQKAQKLIKDGPPTVFIPVKRKQGDRPLSDRIHVANPGNLPTDIPQARAFLEEQFERTTGLTQSIHGGSNTGSADRSATASRQRGDAANARLGDMRSRVEEFTTNVARHEALVVRLELEAEEVRDYVAPGEIDLYRVSITPSQETQELFGIEEIPLRDGKLSMQSVSPQAANYFRTNEEASEAMIKTLQDIASYAEIDYGAYLLSVDLDNTGGQGLDVEQLQIEDPEGMEPPEINLPDGISVRMVTVEDVWEDTAGIGPEALVRELGYEIAAGSMQKFDRGREIAMAETMVGQVMPVAAQIAMATGDVQMFNNIQQRLDDANEVPQDKRLAPLEPPPPPPEKEGSPNAA